MGVVLTTLQRWRRQFLDDKDCLYGRKGLAPQDAQRLGAEERQMIVLTRNKR